MTLWCFIIGGLYCLFAIISIILGFILGWKKCEGWIKSMIKKT